MSQDPSSAGDSDSNGSRVTDGFPQNTSPLKMPKVQPPKQEAPRDQKKEPPRKRG